MKLRFMYGPLGLLWSFAPWVAFGLAWWLKLGGFLGMERLDLFGPGLALLCSNWFYVVALY
jgi:hypothetical protein